MGRISCIEVLPEDLRNQFEDILTGRIHYTCDDLVTWFKEQGYTISRSAIHRYIVANKKSVVNQKQLSKYDALDSYILNLRLECINLAFNITHETDFNKLKQDAENILSWVSQPTK